MYGELLQSGKRNTLKKEMAMMAIGNHSKTKDPMIEEDTLMEVGDPLIEMEDPLEEDTLMEVGDPLIEEDTLVEDPLMEKEDPWTPWRTRTTRPSRTTWACEANNCINPSGNLGLHSIRKYI